MRGDLLHIGRRFVGGAKKGGERLLSMGGGGGGELKWPALLQPKRIGKGGGKRERGARVDPICVRRGGNNSCMGCSWMPFPSFGLTCDFHN